MAPTNSKPSPLGVLTCTTCKGEGELDRGERVAHNDTHEWVEECSSCEGRGVLRCSLCGQDDATGVTEDGFVACPECLAGQCYECRGSGIDSGDQKNASGYSEAYERPCHWCEGTGRVEASSPVRSEVLDGPETRESPESDLEFFRRRPPTTLNAGANT